MLVPAATTRTFAGSFARTSARSASSASTGTGRNACAREQAPWGLCAIGAVETRPTVGKASGRLDEEHDQVVQLLVRQLVSVVLRHEARLEALGDLRVRIDDRLPDGRFVLPRERVVKVGPGRPVCAGRGEGVAAAAALSDEDLLPVLGTAHGGGRR